MPRRPPEPSPRSAARSLAVNGAHLGVLSAFALAQPLFDLLGKNADFFAVRGSTRWDIVLFALGVVFVPPLGLLVIEALAGLVARPLQRALHLVFVGALVGVVTIQVLKDATSLDSTELLIALAALLGSAAALGYWRLKPARSFLSVLSPAPLVFLVLFLFFSPVSDITLASDTEVEVAHVRADTPVVLIVFDEFPITTLLDRDGQIDAVRYPNFARLARGSTWFRNATTVSSGTTRAVPAILTGRYPRSGHHPPVASEHPRSIFTLLGGDYRMNVVEPTTHLCPRAICKNTLQAQPAALEPVSLYSDVGIVYLHLLAPPRLEETLPPITNQWMNFGRDTDERAELISKALAAAKESTEEGKATKKKPRERKRQFYDARAQSFQSFVRSLEPRPRPTFNFAHVWLPHGTWVYFPSGSQSAVERTVAPGRDETDTWLDPFLTVQAYQRHLLQVGFVDRLVGELLAQLHETGLYDRALVVITADHGISFRAGDRRRGSSRTNLQDLAFVPLFVKQPGQKTGEVVDYHVQTVDIVPTIADILGIRIPWRVDGRTALRDPHHDLVRLASVVRLSDVQDPEVTVAFETLLQRKEAALRRQLELFGTGPVDRIFAVDPHPELLGLAPSTLRLAGASGDSARIDDEATRRLLENLSADRPFVPSPLSGHVEGPGARAGRPLAIAVNGSIAAVARTYDDFGVTRFSALAPESAFAPGRNQVEFFWIDGGVGNVRLTQLESA